MPMEINGFRKYLLKRLYFHISIMFTQMATVYDALTHFTDKQLRLVLYVSVTTERIHWKQYSTVKKHLSTKNKILRCVYVCFFIQEVKVNILDRDRINECGFCNDNNTEIMFAQHDSKDIKCESIRFYTLGKK